MHYKYFTYGKGFKLGIDYYTQVSSSDSKNASIKDLNLATNNSIVNSTDNYHGYEYFWEYYIDQDISLKLSRNNKYIDFNLAGNLKYNQSFKSTDLALNWINSYYNSSIEIAPKISWVKSKSSTLFNDNSSSKQDNDGLGYGVNLKFNYALSKRFLLALKYSYFTFEDSNSNLYHYNSSGTNTDISESDLKYNEHNINFSFGYYF
jgi:hypothetical protein